MAMIIPFSKAPQKNWSHSEQSEFFRAVNILRTTGLPIVTESGMSDEGDPWTIFLREDTGDVVVHICRIEGQVIAASAASSDIVSGSTFRAVIDRILRSQPLVLPTTSSSGTLFLHPSAVITAFIATAFSWSCSEEAQLKQYAWNIDKDGQLDPGLHPVRIGQSRSILADAITSKSEAISTAESISALSGRLGIAASIAAVVLAADIAKGTPTAPWQDLTTQSSEVTASEHSASRSALPSGLDAPLFHLPDDGYQFTAPGQFSHAAIDATGAVDVSFASWVHQRDYFSTANSEAAAVLTQSEDRSASRVLENQELSYGIETPTAIKLAGETSAPVAPARASSGDSARPISPETFQQSSGHEFQLADASEFLTYLLSQKIGATHASLQDLSTAVTALTADHLKKADGSGDASAPSSQPHSAYDDGGYKLVEDILNFAFDHSKELSTSASDWMSFSRGLKSNAFLPEADRVLIIDLPDLQAEAFKFADGLVMVSQEFAARYLPGASLTPQSQLDVSDGVVLKLIGVVDMAPSLHT